MYNSRRLSACDRATQIYAFIHSQADNDENRQRQFMYLNHEATIFNITKLTIKWWAVRKTIRPSHLVID